MTLANSTQPDTVDRSHCEARDRADALSGARARFRLPENKIYLDGNSLGAMPQHTAAAIEAVIAREWGHDLIGSWNRAGWADLPRTVGAALARLLGALPGEALIADSTSVNIFKLLAGILTLPHIAADPQRTVIVSERGNFPTDLYIAEGVNRLLGGRFTLRLLNHGELLTAFDHTTAAALVTQVDYCSGFLHDMAPINRAAQLAGCHVLWDLSHSTGALPLHLNDDGAEFAVGCGYKYLNGGPGAPGYLYVAKNWQTRLSTPLSGWFGHKTPFLFAPSYMPADDISRFLCGTPSVLATVALRCGIETFDGINMDDVRQKSLALTDLFRSLMEQFCPELRCVTPQAHHQRGSQLAFAHDHAYAIMQAIIDRGVVGDFRQPDLMRFGFTPLYTRFVDCWDAVMLIRDVLASNVWREDKYQIRHAVT